MIQFNLIFVIIIGIAVLSFFIFFTTKYIDLEHKKEAAEIARDIDLTLRGLKSTTQYNSLNVAFNFELEPMCDRISINDGDFYQTVDYIFFSDESDTSNLVFWIEEFNKPFRVDNLIFIIDNDKEYYSTDSSFFPNFVNQGNSGSYDVGVFFGGDCPANNPISGRKVVCVRNNQIELNGEVFPLVDDVLIYGAAFSSVDQFNCSLNKLATKWINLFDVYIGKNEMMSDCSDVRNSLNEKLLAEKNKLVVGDYEVDFYGLDSLNVKLSNFECGVVY